MPFNYTKVGSDSNEDAVHEYHPGPGKYSAVIETLKAFGFLRWLVTIFLLVATLGCELWILHKETSVQEPGSEINRMIPQFSRQRKILIDDRAYISNHKAWSSINASMEHWTKLLPPGGGFVHVPEHADHILPPPIHDQGMRPDQDTYALAVYHELHCLIVMAGYVDRLVMKMREGLLEVDEDALEHNEHCVMYLRKVIVYTADTTLEGQSQDLHWIDEPGTDGLGAIHVCRDIDEMTARTTKRERDDAKGYQVLMPAHEHSHSHSHSHE